MDRQWLAESKAKWGSPRVLERRKEIANPSN
jgi:hypothetical protein